jgi:hypothetical protein
MERHIDAKEDKIRNKEIGVAEIRGDQGSQESRDHEG